MHRIRKGDRVRVVDSLGCELPRIALTGPVQGDDFSVVWVCKEADWQKENGAVTHDKAMAWPVDAIIAR